MKSYTYTCRGKDGTLKRGRLEASDRADALRQLKGQGYLPFSISEGARATHPQKKRHLVLLTAAAALAVIAGAVFSLSISPRKHPQEPSAARETSAVRLPPKKDLREKPDAVESHGRPPSAGERSLPAATSGTIGS